MSAVAGRERSAAGLSMQAVAASIRNATFGEAAAKPAIGIEAEFLALDTGTRKVASLYGQLLPVMDTFAETAGWQRIESDKGAARFRTPANGSVTFEPGGQLEFATPPFDKPAQVLVHLEKTLQPLIDYAADSGITLLGAGIDPFNTLDETPLQVNAERYICMDAYFRTISLAGPRMMRQTASIQVNIGTGRPVAADWRLANALVPYLTAIFANSQCYAGSDTGFASYRARMWRELDASRTGLAWQPGDPAQAYADFALEARAMFMRSPEGEYLPFRDWVCSGKATEQSVATHVSTLFPEVRPRGAYLELRAIDALPLNSYAAPMLLTAALLLDPVARKRAEEVAGEPDPGLLNTAAERGLKDPVIHRVASDLISIAQDRLMMDGAYGETAMAFFQERGLSP